MTVDVAKLAHQPREDLNSCYQVPIVSSDPSQVARRREKRVGQPGMTVSRVREEETGGGKRALDSATGAPASNGSARWAGERPSSGGRKGESRHMMALEG